MGSNAPQWMKEYIQTASQEIYPAILPDTFRGMNFVDASLLIYKTLGAVMFALGVPNESFRDKQSENAPRIVAGDFDIHMNPGQRYRIQGGEIAFMITSRADIARKVSLFGAHHILDVGRTSPRDPEQQPLLDTEEDPSSSVRVPLITPVIRPAPRSRSSSNLEAMAPDDGHFATDDMLLPRAQGKTRIDRLRKTTADGTMTLVTDMTAEFTDSRMSRKQSSHEAGFVARILNNAMGLATGETLPRNKRPKSQMSTEARLDKLRYPDHISLKIDKHLLLCDPSPTFPVNIEYFIAPLRAPHLIEDGDSWRPIVILSPDTPNERQRRVLERFEQVYVVKGNPMSRRDLHRVGVERCVRAVVLTNSARGKVK